MELSRNVTGSVGELAGLHVLEFGHYVAAPHCAMILADHGADVIKVEPTDGEPGRRSAPLGSHEMSYYFSSHNRRKKSLALDLHSDEAAPILKALLSWADVVVTNYSPGTPERLGFGYEQIKVINPRCVLVHIMGFGRNTGYSDYAAFDGVLQAMSGFSDLNGEPTGPPHLSGVQIADHAAAIHGAFAAMAALWKRISAGEGEYLEISMLRVMTSMLSFIVPQFGIDGRAATRSGNRPEMRFVNVYCAKDGYVYVAPISKAMWRSLMDLLESPQWAETEVVETGRYFKDPDLRQLIDSRLGSWIEERSASVAVSVLQGRGIASAHFLGIEDLFHDSALGPWTLPLKSSSGWEGVAAAGSFGDCGIDSALVPSLGEHSREVLIDIGVSRDEVERLIASGVVVWE